jgi:predicted enzyme related to lactoylglutathione lyase
MAVCHDPCGAELDVWEPRKLQGTDVDDRRHGAPSWFEARVGDVDRASRFYAALFGWTPEVLPMDGDRTYTRFTLGGAAVAGMLAITPRMGHVRPSWVTYVTVEDAEKSVALAARLGAGISLPLREAPGMGRFAGLTSPQEVPFHVVEYAR